MKTMLQDSASSVIPIRLTGLPAALREEGFVPLDYRLLREAAANATIPAHQVNGMWHFLRRDTEEIARALKLTRVDLTRGNQLTSARPRSTSQRRPARRDAGFA